MTSAFTSSRSTWLGSAILASLLAAPAVAQVNYSETFPTTAAGWTGSGGYQPGWSDNSACADGCLRSNIYDYGGPSALACSFVSPLLGTTLGGNVDLAFDYKHLE